MVEFWFVFPILLFVFLNMIQYGLLAQSAEVVTHLSREGARFASQGAATPDEAIQKYVQDEAKDSRSFAR
jgi:Flp pilus assembly protein TadG